MTTNLHDILADYDRRYDPALCMVGETFHAIGYHSRMTEGAWVHSTRLALDYALALLEAGEAGRACDVLDKVVSLQDTDPVSPTYGIWSWLLEEPLPQMAPPDWNWADFLGARLAQALVLHRDALPDALAVRMGESLGHAAWSIFRRNVGPSYTNIALMGAAVTAAAGELLDEPRLLAYGRRRLRRFMESTEFHGGLNEYNSPTYTIVALDECERMLLLVRDAGVRADAEALRAFIWGTIAEHFHPGTAQWAGPHSRAYSNRLAPHTAGRLAAMTGAPVPVHPSVPAGTSQLPQAGLLPCPEELRARFVRLPAPEVEVRRRFIRRETEEASTYGVTWLCDDACLGSVSHGTGWNQNRPVLAYWRTADDPAVVLRVRVLHDGRDFAGAAVRSAQQGPRVLTAFGLFTGAGDFHPSLDCPPGGVYTITDLRVRYELLGVGARVETLGADRYALRAGDRRVVLYAPPGRFGDATVTWAPGEIDGGVCLDGLCYAGPAHPLDPATMGPVALAVAATLGPEVDAPPTLHEDGDTLAWAWDSLTLTTPARAVPFAF